MSALPKILVVDDDPVVGKSFNRVLSGKGYIVVTAHDGPEALKRLAEGEYDLVYTDIRMPGMDGIEVAERVKARRPWTPVVIVTGYGTEENEVRAKAAGVAEVLHKPLSPEMIAGSAAKALHLIGGTAVEAPVAAVAAPAAPVLDHAPEAPRDVRSVLGTALAMAVAPVVGLAFIVAAPFVGLALLLWMGAAAVARSRIVKSVALMLAAPLVGLAYVIALPFIGLGALAWMGVRELARGGAFGIAARKAAAHVGNIVLFFAAPFIGLAYALAFPFIGIVLLIRSMRKDNGTR